MPADWVRILEQVEQRPGNDLATLYDVAELLVQVSRDSAFLRFLSERKLSAHTVLNRALQGRGVDVDFGTLEVLLLKFPQRQQWVASDLRTLRIAAGLLSPIIV